MTLDVEEIVDGDMGGNEALGLPLRLEALHLALSPACAAEFLRPALDGLVRDVDSTLGENLTHIP